MDVSGLGEFGLIDRLASQLGVPSDERLVVGIGDDAAVVRAGDAFVILTTDTMVAGVHFLPGEVPWRDVGWKALAVNVSDIAAMGGAPAFALVTLALPPSTPVDAVDQLYSGLRKCAERFGVTVAGGDIVASDTLTITVALTGEAMRAATGEPLLLRRNAARAGDAVGVTGALGGSAGGVRALLEGLAGRPQMASLVARHMRPAPRVDAGRAAVENGARCGIDISDGLAQDLGHICEASGLGADLHLERLPVDPSLTAAFPDDARTLAATGGEDYELLLVAPDDVLARTGAALGQPIAIVGAMTAGHAGVRVLDANGNEIALASPGWDHLGRRR